MLAWVGIALPLAVLLDVPLPIWAGQPTPRPVLTAAAPSDELGWAGALIAVGFTLFLCLPYRPYLLALNLARLRVSPRVLFLLTGLLAAIGLLTYPRFGSDIFDYAAYERMWVVYGDNPLLAVVANRPMDWTFPFVNVQDRTPAYGPLWVLLTWPIVRLAGDSAMAIVVGYKLLSAIAYAVCCWLIWNTVEPVRRRRALMLFAWSPLVLFEVLGKVHNDSLTAVSMLGVIWLAGRGRARAGILVGVAGALIKGTALAAVPPLALRLWRQERWHGQLAVLSGSLILAVALYAPFWAGPRSLDAIWNQTGNLSWSLATVLTALAQCLTGARLDLLVRAALMLIWAAVCVQILRRYRLERSDQLATSSGWLLMASLLLLTAAVYGHYFVPLVALAAVAGSRLLDRVVLWLSIGGLAVYSVGALGWVFQPTWIGSIEYQVVGSMVLFGPAAVASVLTWWHRGVLWPQTEPRG